MLHAHRTNLCGMCLESSIVRTWILMASEFPASLTLFSIIHLPEVLFDMYVHVSIHDMCLCFGFLLLLSLRFHSWCMCMCMCLCVCSSLKYKRYLRMMCQANTYQYIWGEAVIALWRLPLYKAQTSSSHFSHLFLAAKAIDKVIEGVRRQGERLSLSQMQDQNQSMGSVFVRVLASGLSYHASVHDIVCAYACIHVMCQHLPACVYAVYA